MKKLIALLFCAALLGASAGCSDDKDEQINLSQLMGKWECYQDYDGEDDFMDTEYAEGVDLYLLIFRENGTGARLDGIRYTDPWKEFTYSVDGNILRWSIDMMPYIEKLTSSELVLAYDYGDGSAPDKEYFRRIE